MVIIVWLAAVAGMATRWLCSIDVRGLYSVSVYRRSYQQEPEGFSSLCCVSIHLSGVSPLEYIDHMVDMEFNRGRRDWGTHCQLVLYGCDL